MKLLLTSNGFTPEIEKEFFTLLAKDPSECRVAFITTSAYGEPEGPDYNILSFLEEYRVQLRDRKITKIEEIDVKNKTQEELEKIILDKDIVFVNGGNTFYLMHWINKSGFKNVVKKFLEKGGLYFGISAGSIVACPTIVSATWMPPDLNLVNLKDLTGMGFVDFLIHPHFHPGQKEVLEKDIEDINYPIVAITNDQAVLAQDNGVKIIGEGEKYFFKGFKES